MELPRYKSNEELPVTLTAKDVAGYLNISLTSGYNLMNSKGFPVLKFGKQLRVTRENFLNWLNTTTEVIYK